MQSRCWWTAPALVACLAVGMLLGAEDERGHERRHDSGDAGDLEAKIHHALPRIINEGADLYNCGRPVDCYELWRGALLTFLPLLDQHHHLQRTIDETLHRAAHMKNPCEAAFTLRAAIDELRRETAHRPEPKRPMPPAAKEQPKEKVEKKEPPAPPDAPVGPAGRRPRRHRCGHDLPQPAPERRADSLPTQQGRPEAQRKAARRLEGADHRLHQLAHRRPAGVHGQAPEGCLPGQERHQCRVRRGRRRLPQGAADPGHCAGRQQAADEYRGIDARRCGAAGCREPRETLRKD